MKVNKFHLIGQVCEITNLPHSTIRYWEKNFPRLKPSRSSGGHRYYSDDQVELIKYIKKILHEEGYTIEGAKKRLAEERSSVKNKKEPLDATEKNLLIKSELQEILALLNKK